MFVNRTCILVEFGDCDPANIVYFAKYFYWFDQCTSALFRASGFPLDKMYKTQDILIPVVDAHARFIQPSSYGDALIVETQLSEWKTSSFVVSHRLLLDDALTAEGWITHAWATAHPTLPHRMKSIPFPSEVIRKLTA